MLNVRKQIFFFYRKLLDFSELNLASTLARKTISTASIVLNFPTWELYYNESQ